VLVLAFLARADLSLHFVLVDLHHDLSRTVLAENLAAEVTVVSAEEKVELILTNEAVLGLLVRDPQLLLIAVVLGVRILAGVDHLLTGIKDL